MNSKLILGDCLEKLKELPDESIDLAIIDPPYLQDSHGEGGAFGSKKRDYHKGVDSLGHGFKNIVLDEIVRVLKKVNLYIFCSKNQILQILTYFQNYKYDILAYHKTNPCPTCNNKYLSDTEYIIFVRESGVPLFGTYHTKRKYFIQKNAKSDWDHPTVKPLNIIKILVENSSKENDIVLDPFLGSGTTAVAAKMLDRKYIGIEKDPEYFKIAQARIDAVQDNLFSKL